MLLWEWLAWMDGYNMRMEDEWRQTRELMATMFNARGAKVTGREMIRLLSEKPKEEEREVKPIPDLDARIKVSESYKGKREVKLSSNEFMRSIR